MNKTWSNNDTNEQNDDDITLHKWRKIIDYGWHRYDQDHPIRLKRRIRKGIPDCMRGTIWQLITGSVKMKKNNPGVYKRLVEAEVSPWEDDIARDINRTFPSHMLYRDRHCMGQRCLFNVLKAISINNERVGYCQGMGFVTGILLLYMDEESAFWVVNVLLSDPKYQMQGLYISGMPLLAKYLYLLERLLQHFLPQLYSHLRREDIRPSLYASQWFITLFSSSFPLSCVVRIWDLFLYEGPKALFRVALAVLQLGQEKFLSSSFERLVPAIKFVQSSMDAQELVEVALRMRVRSEQLRSFEAEYVELK